MERNSDSIILIQIKRMTTKSSRDEGRSREAERLVMNLTPANTSAALVELGYLARR